MKKISGAESAEELFPFPIVSDRNRKLSLYLNVLDAKCTDKNGVPLPCRATFILAPDLTIQLIHFYPQTTGRDFEYLYKKLHRFFIRFKFKMSIKNQFVF